MLQEFFINEIEDTTENDELYSIMNKRISYCKNLMNSEEGYGPGDICYLVKEIQTKSFLGLAVKKVSKIGSYHNVYGLDTSNLACISAYISKYIQKLNSTNAKITQSIFCVFDYFLEKDLRILIKFPGGLRKIFYIDEEDAIEANSGELRTVFLSSILRSWNLNRINSNDLFLEELNNVDSFNYMIDSIEFLVKENSEMKDSNLKSKIVKFLESFLKFLMDTRRFSLAILNFSKLSDIDNSLIKYAIEPLKYLNLFEDALSYLASTILKNSSQENLYLEIDLLTNLGKFEEAIEIANFVTSSNPENSEFWISLAEIYLKKKDFTNCLKVLNNVYVLSENLNINPIFQEFEFYEISVSKNKISNFQLKFSEILLDQKNIIDMCYSNSQNFRNENSEIIYETIKKILTCDFLKFDKLRKKIYYQLLEVIKEMNFDSFCDLKKKIFFPKDLNTNNKNGNEIETFRSSADSLDIFSKSSKDFHKISTNPNFEIILENLIEDYKIFGVMISENEGYFSMLFNKEDLSVWEIKFCISIGILAERLKYFNTSLNFYKKAAKHCYSRFVYMRIIKIYMKIKDFKNAMSTLATFLSYIPNVQFKFINRTPRWLDKIILKILYEHQINEIISWITNSPIHIIDFILKRVIEKYKNWIEVGHELHFIK